MLNIEGPGIGNGPLEIGISHNIEGIAAVDDLVERASVSQDDHLLAVDEITIEGRTGVELEISGVGHGVFKNRTFCLEMEVSGIIHNPLELKLDLFRRILVNSNHSDGGICGVGDIRKG